MKKQIYLLTEEQLLKIIEINNREKNYIMTYNCDLGNFIFASDEINSYEELKPHLDYIQSQNLEITEIEIEDDY
jgi:hypothetical protein